ncbi:hemerythrin domain-containing protein [Streptacidiphilus sp. PB12-B1b]|uniref:hemerythrin domain-containing protein n=1 Tax=Streptacidiphilus sp. PB12-B1b TaxID=2705012 RepID=UPI0015FBCEFB|nr:hemerythrin domain-containing protein [Streptacidiphilus sp. PB12-B1b]QMU77076.1 hemerythrin domain-containing protein [Streptacidiphilus sp. PB12-B1b]
MSGDILDELEADHESVRRLFGSFTGHGFHDPERKRIIDEAGASLLRQAHLEEAYLYPLARELPEGEEDVRQGLAENAEIEALLAELESYDQDTPGFEHRVAQLVERATGHINQQEARLFPLLRAQVPAASLEQLGADARTARQAPPRRPRRGTAALPPDDLPEPERPLTERIRSLLSGAGPGRDQSHPAGRIG